MTIESELMALKDQDGMIHPAEVVEWAGSNPQSDLHHAIEWNDERAAHEYRIWQVRRLIAIHVVQEDGRRSTISLVSDRSRGGGYRAVDDVMRNLEMRNEALTQALAELDRFRERYEYLRELAGVFEEAERVRVSTVTRRRRPKEQENRISA